MAFTTTPTGKSYLDNTLLPKLLERFEDYISVPYDDGKHMATIGIGINLKVSGNLALVLKYLGLNPDTNTVAAFRQVINANPLSRDGEVAGTSQSEIDLLKALNVKLREYGVTKDFVVSNDQDAYQIKSDYILGYTAGSYSSQGAQKELDDKLKANGLEGVIVHDTYEYMALMSLYFNGPSLIKPALIKAIKEGDHAEAWYLISYEFNNQPPEIAGGIAKRRFAEAALFGLYGDRQNPSIEDAKLAYRMFTLHQEKIFAYENLHQSRIASANAVLAATTGVQSYIKAGTIAVALGGEDGNSLAKGVLVREINDTYKLDLSAANYRATDIYLDPGRENSEQKFDQNHKFVFDASTYTNGEICTENNILIGEGGDDTLIGGAGDDVLIGGEGADYLQGGEGNDTYAIKAGDGFDLIKDTDGSGKIVMDGETLAGGNKSYGTKVYKLEETNGTNTTTKHTYVFIDDSTLLIDNKILVENFDKTKTYLGLTFNATENELPGIAKEINGDLEPIDHEPIVDGIQVDYDDLGNVKTYDSPEPNREDSIYDSVANDLINGKGGNDKIWGERGGDDIFIGGDGRDVLAGGNGKDWLYGGEEPITIEAAIAAGNAQTGGGDGDWLNGGAGDDVLIGGATNDALMGGNGKDILIGGAGNDDIDGDNDWTATDTIWTVREETNADGTFTRVFEPVYDPFPTQGGADVIYAGEGNDHAWGNFGDDILFGESGDDYLDGGDDNDILVGGTGKDNLQGDQGNDYLSGDAEDDDLTAGSGDDILAGGTDTDTLWGGAGKDIYIYKKGDGEDTIIDKAADENIIRFGEGIDSQNIIINPGGVTLNFGDGDGLHILLDTEFSAESGTESGTQPSSVSYSFTYDSSGNINSVTVDAINQPDYFASMGVSAFEFADGTRLTSDELLAKGFDINGTESADLITGTNAIDRINGLGGDDVAATVGLMKAWLLINHRVSISDGMISEFKNKNAANQNQLRRMA